MLNLKKYFLLLCFPLFACTPQSCSQQSHQANDPEPSLTTMAEADDFVDFVHYDEGDTDSELTPEDESPEVDRLLASTTEEQTPPTPVVQRVVDKKWGSFEIEIRDYGHPAFSPFEVKIYVLCNEQVKMKKQRPAPQKELVLKSLKACEFKSHAYNQDNSTLTIKYLMQSPNASPNEPVCNELWEQEFVLSEICSQWTTH